MSSPQRPDVDRDRVLTVASRSPGVTARYRSHVAVFDGEDCWWWTGAISSAGHGRFWVQRSVVVIAHRFGWLVAHPGRSLPDLLAHQVRQPAVPASRAPSPERPG